MRIAQRRRDRVREVESDESMPAAQRAAAVAAVHREADMEAAALVQQVAALRVAVAQRAPQAAQKAAVGADGAALAAELVQKAMAVAQKEEDSRSTQRSKQTALRSHVLRDM